jgi:iron(III) transport system permease protein
MRARTPLALWAAALAATALVALPLTYLVVRTADAGSRALDVLGRERVPELVLQTVALVAGVTAVSVAIALPLAWLITRTDLPARRAWTAAAALPLVVPSYVGALALLAAFGPRGIMQGWLEPFGVERLPEIYGYGGALVALVLTTYPYVFLLTVSALRELDPSLEEASRSLGRSSWQTFRAVTLPALRPAAGAGSLLVALYALSDFGAVSLMRYDSLTRAIFVQYRALFDRTPAAVLALVLVALTAIVLVLEQRARGRGRYHRSAPGAARHPRPVALGRWRWPALAFCTTVVGFALLLPVSVLAYWAARASSSEPFVDALRAAGNSVVASLLAAVAAVTAAMPVAVLAVRYRSRATAVLERSAYASNALPGIVIALSLVFFAANYAEPIYQTLFLLVVAYVVRFFPEAVAGAHSALLRVDPRLEDAARGLGRSPISVAATVVAPLVAGGLATGATLVFLSTMKELPATLLLRPTGFDTLATEVWTATGLGHYSQAAPAALLLLVVSAPLVLRLTSRRLVESQPGG